MLQARRQSRPLKRLHRVAATAIAPSGARRQWESRPQARARQQDAVTAVLLQQLRVKVRRLCQSPLLVLQPKPLCQQAEQVLQQ